MEQISSILSVLIVYLSIDWLLTGVVYNKGGICCILMAIWKLSGMSFFKWKETGSLWDLIYPILGDTCWITPRGAAV